MKNLCKLSAVSSQLSALSCQPSVVSSQLSAVGLSLTLPEQFCGTGFGLWPRCANDAVK
ncbi:MAG: hypothetical protein F6J90_34205 [Moorea sp. SIOASIH]|uniref:hypothetical protein n=1 Tax=Moorena sp. SIOASIH TaxID=2607817 RepID=UPI0013BA2E64|nr:hypothetical protein [Moorena sp. SIOASIH]NEO41105.1 hypothetical protein [Moorena sp. SIOASIH]